MMNRHDYCLQHSSPPSDLAMELYTYTQQNIHGAQMLIGPLEGALIVSYLNAIKAKNMLELGTYTGYSALSFVEGCPSLEELITLDVNTETTTLAQNFWNRSPRGRIIKSVIGKALETLESWGDQKYFDAIFIDADKANYPLYWNWSKTHLRPEGIIFCDNVLWSDKVLDENYQDNQTEKLRECARQATRDSHFFSVLLPIRDGLLISIKK
jgi:caffeoyl-CoA O-methyltransferase